MIPTPKQIDEMFDARFKVLAADVEAHETFFVEEKDAKEVKQFIHTIRESDGAEMVKEIREWAVNHSGATRDECQNEKVIPTSDLHALLAVLGITKE